MTRALSPEAARHLAALQTELGFEFPGEVVRLETPRSDGDRPLHIFAGRGDLGAVKALLAAGVQVDSRGDLNLTPLYNAVAIAKNHEVAEALLNAGADAMAAGEFGWTPLSSARRLGDRRMIDLLEATRDR